MIDLIIVLSYFFLIFLIAISKGYDKNLSADEYFLSSRKLKWPSIALSTIATNVNGYQFLGMMGSAYLYGLAQANLEINHSWLLDNRKALMIGSPNAELLTE